MTKKRKLVLTLSDAELDALKKFKRISYYDGGYDLAYKRPKGYNFWPPTEKAIVKVLSKVARQARAGK